MTLSELTCLVSRSGSLLIPAEAIADMGLKPGDPIHVAYISKDGKTNDFREFLLSEAGVEGIDAGEAVFQVPTQLLEQANIPADSDLQIACFDGLIVICRSSSLELEELSEILERLKTARQFADYYSCNEDLSDIKTRLADTIQHLNEGGVTQ